MPSMDEVYQKYARMVYRFLLSKTHDENIAEELTQETFYQAVRCIGKYDESCKISTWLCAIAKNQLREYLRKYPPRENIYAQNHDQSQRVPSAEEDYFKAAERITLMKRLHSCPEPFREVLYLRIFGNLSFKEIGEIMGKTENWARVTFYRGKEKLRKDVRNDEK
ncbi:MAG: RNA polymerase sigma factor [Lachnospiraceae bacterium]